MNLTDWLAGMRSILDDPSTAGSLQAHTDAQLVEVGHQQLLAIVKRMAEVDERWHNHEMTLAAAAARQVASNVWEYTIPQWLMTISDMREENQGASVTASLGPRIHPIQSKYTNGVGYDFQSGNSFRLYGKSAALDLRLQVTKRPARPTRGTLPAQTSMTSSQLRLDVDPAVSSDFPHEKQADAYAGSLFEITGVNDATAQPGGQVRRCIGSTHTQLLAGPNTLHTILTLEFAWTTIPETSDTYEMHWELPDQHVRLHQLMTARAMWQRQGNADEVKAHRDETAELGMSLINDVKKRQSQAPKRMIHSIGGDYGGRYDRLHDPLSWHDLYG